MRKRHFLFASVLALLCSSGALHAQDFKLTSSGYFKNQGVDVMAFDDIYPEGHQGGVCIIMNGHRVATNGDIRLEATPRTMAARTETTRPEAQRQQHHRYALLSRLLTPPHRIQPDDLPGSPPYIYGTSGKQR